MISDGRTTHRFKVFVVLDNKRWKCEDLTPGDPLLSVTVALYKYVNKKLLAKILSHGGLLFSLCQLHRLVENRKTSLAL